MIAESRKGFQEYSPSEQPCDGTHRQIGKLPNSRTAKLHRIFRDSVKYRLELLVALTQ